MNGTKDAPITARPRLVSRLFSAALVSLGVVFVVYALTPQTVGETARRHVLNVFQERYPDHIVSLRRGYFDQNVGFVFEDLRIIDPSRVVHGAEDSELLRIERLTVEADLMPIRWSWRIASEDAPYFLTAYTPALGYWTMGLYFVELLPMPNFGSVTPRMEIRHLRLQLVDDHWRIARCSPRFLRC